jgi:hypothetical protein
MREDVIKAMGFTKRDLRRMALLYAVSQLGEDAEREARAFLSKRWPQASEEQRRAVVAALIED